MSGKPLKGQSVLVIDDDALSAFRLHKRLVQAGARVASGDMASARPYLGAAALAVVVVSASLNGPDLADLLPELRRCKAPWVAYGRPADARVLATAVFTVPAGDTALLVETLAALVAGPRH